MNRRVAMLVGLALVGGLAAPGDAVGDGLPVLGATGPSNGIVSRDGARRYRAQPRTRTTLVTAVSASGRVMARALVPGRFDIPIVAYDGTASGLSADGQTLVLIRPRVAFPQRSTELAVLDARTLRPRRLIALAGDFSFDAVSAGGGWVFLIQYTSPVDPTRYRVRALNVASGRLSPRDIVDPTESDEVMRGNPLTRAVSADGRWAYTLYDGNGRPFVHALDTARQTARCIDVAPFPAAVQGWGVRLRLVHDRLSVVSGPHVLSQINTRTFVLVAPPAPRKVVGDLGSADTLSAAVPITVFLALGLVIVVVRRRYRPGRDTRVQ